MRIVILFFGLLSLFASCKKVCFTSPQPQKGVVVKSFLKDIQGHYADSLLDITISKTELLVNGSKYMLVSKAPASDGEVLIKYFNNSYFVNFKDSIYFSVFMARFFEGKLAVYMLNADERSITTLNKFVKASPIEGNTSIFLVGPSVKEFDQIIENELFDVITVLPQK